MIVPEGYELMNNGFVFSDVVDLSKLGDWAVEDFIEQRLAKKRGLFALGANMLGETLGPDVLMSETEQFQTPDLMRPGMVIFGLRVHFFKKVTDACPDPVENR